MHDSNPVKHETQASAKAVAITILYFARLRELFGRASEQLFVPPRVATVGALREYLRTRGGVWEVELADAKTVRIAVNQEMVPSSAPLREGDEVAFFPPVTGG